nr:hypothetical protein [Curtobacterium sp. PhB172]
MNGELCPADLEEHVLDEPKQLLRVDGQIGVVARGLSLGSADDSTVSTQTDDLRVGTADVDPADDRTPVCALHERHSVP